MQSKILSETHLAFIGKSIVTYIFGQYPMAQGLPHEQIRDRVPGGGKSVKAKRFIYSIIVESFRD